MNSGMVHCDVVEGGVVHGKVMMWFVVEKVTRNDEKTLERVVVGGCAESAIRMKLKSLKELGIKRFTGTFVYAQQQQV